jgi:hypothetical protein
VTDQKGLEEDLFDGSEEHLEQLMQAMRNVLEQTGHARCLKDSVACDAIDATARVCVLPQMGR